MKKLITILLTILTLCACSNKQSINKDSEIYKLIEQGYTWTSISITEEDGVNCLGTILYNEETDDYVAAFADITSEQYEEYNQLDIFEDGVAHNYLCSLDVKEVLPLDSYIPTQETLDSYIGMTLQEFEELGFYQNGNWCDDNNRPLYSYDNDVYVCEVYVNELQADADFDDYSVNQTLQFTISELKYTELSSNILSTINNQ